MRKAGLPETCAAGADSRDIPGLVLLCGGDKRTQDAEIARAIRLAKKL
jgi:putative component of toxin-antitoxin plasmid stabilization module